MKGVQRYELFGGIALKNHTFIFLDWTKKTEFKHFFSMLEKLRIASIQNVHTLIKQYTHKNHLHTLIAHKL